MEESLAAQGIDVGSGGCAPAWPVARALIQFDPLLAGVAEVAGLCCALGAPEGSQPGSGELFGESDPERRPCMAAVFAKARAAEGFEAMAAHAMRMGMLDARWVDSANDHGRCKAASFSEMAKGVAIKGGRSWRRWRRSPRAQRMLRHRHLGAWPFEL